MSFSLNEVEAMARKAARGAGFDWGVAEDAGRAVRWLCVQGIDGVAALCSVLGRAHPDTDCPLLLGCALSDRAAHLLKEPMRLEGVAQPVLLLPFIAMAARQTSQTLWVECDGAHAVTDGRGLAMTRPFVPKATYVEICVDGVLSAPRPHQSRAQPDAADWETLTGYAHRTYAPATEDSRLRGAGAGLSDND
ncbi:DUF3726 domain-containing protein [Shimia aestuarii]|uniref:DUF3726 domain-containing protein n=1 Tax=Shimia aestuarii TaxID=254406 RepID=UPI001FB2A400|nr:DUF3726 domain-containing protein [Shimia aestuarii]